MSCVGASPAPTPARETAVRQHVERRPPAGQGRQQRGEPRWHGACSRRRTSSAKAAEVAASGSSPRKNRCQTSSRERVGEVDGRVLAVVEEALLATHIADGRLGDHHALQTGRHVPARLGCRADACDPHEVTEGDDAHAAPALHHRRMVVVRARPGSAHAASTRSSGPSTSGREVIHSRTCSRSGSPLPAADRSRSRSVRMPTTLPSSVTTTDPCRPPASPAPPAGQCVVCGAGHRGGGHEVAHSRFHASHYGPATVSCKC